MLKNAYANLFSLHIIHYWFISGFPDQQYTGDEYLGPLPLPHPKLHMANRKNVYKCETPPDCKVHFLEKTKSSF